MKKNILIISIYYPPIESIASNRIYSFAKYLDKDKYNIFVHTLKTNKEYKNSLNGVEIFREQNNPLFKVATFQNRTNKLLHYTKVIYNKLLAYFTKDIYQDWIDRSYKSLQKLIEEKEIDIIISSFAPEATHKLALKLKKKYPHIKWIADMRDEMSKSPFISAKTKQEYQGLEQEIFKYANAITSVSKPILDEFKSMSQNGNLIFKEIRNGYDFKIEKKKSKNSLFTISYIGSFYGERNPNNFLKALNSIIQDGKINDIKVKFIGVKTHFEIPKNLEDKIEIIPQVEHKEAIKLMKNSDILLLIHPNNGAKGVFTGKLFEYLATLNPILALIDTQDVAAKLIQNCNSGYVCEPNDLEAIKRAIIELYKKNKKIEPNIEIIEKHHRYKQAKRLEKLIEELLNG